MTNYIFQYTRAMAIADGVLVDVSHMAKEAGYKYPVAMTQAAASAVSQAAVGFESDAGFCNTHFVPLWCE